MPNARLSTLRFLLLVAALLTSASVNAGLFGFSGDSWKEEVLLHDGQKVIVKRSQTYGGRHEIGHGGAISGQELSFTLPSTNKTITFKDEYSEDIGGRNFLLLALHILNGTPYVVVQTVGCFSDNKWGRPSPPYLFFKYDGKVWQRITVAEFPAELSTINLVVETKGEAKTITAQAVVTANQVKEINSRIYHRNQVIQRDLARYEGPGACGEMIYDGQGGWHGTGLFGKTYDACLQICAREKIGSQYCPCERLFKMKKE